MMHEIDLWRKINLMVQFANKGTIFYNINYYYYVLLNNLLSEFLIYLLLFSSLFCLLNNLTESLRDISFSLR